MNRPVIQVIILFFFMTCFLFAATPDEIASKIHRFSQAAVLIEADGKKIYIDPLEVKDLGKADIILITHPHFDHLSLDNISKIFKSDTSIIAPAECVPDIEKKFKTKVISLLPWKSVTVKDIEITAVPAYNIVKKEKHGTAKQWVGYIVKVEGIKIYHAGDTERIPEMKKISADIILVPLGQTYTMNSVKDAADSAIDVKASIAIPMHYGQYEGKDSDAVKFAELLKGKIKVIIKEREKP